jgi:hypothetical protein
MKPKHISLPRASKTYLGPGNVVEDTSQDWIFPNGFEITLTTRGDESYLTYHIDGKVVDEKDWIMEAWDGLSEEQQELIMLEGFELMELLKSKKIFNETSSPYRVRRSASI